jgi:O-antigen ligase
MVLQINIYSSILFLLFLFNLLAFTNILNTNLISTLRLPFSLLLIQLYILINFKKRIVIHRSQLGILIIILIFICWIFIGTITSLEQINSLTYFLWLTLNVLLIYGIVAKIRNHSMALVYLLSIVSVILIYHLLSIVLFSGSSIVYRGENIGFKGIFNNNNTFGMISMLSCTSTICMLSLKGELSKKTSIFLRLNLVISLLATLVSNSRASVLGVVLSLIVLYIFNKKFKRVVGLSFLAILIYNFSVEKIYEYFRINSFKEDGLFGERTGLYEFAIKSLKYIPIQGLGIGRQEDLWEISPEGYPVSLSNELVGFSFHNSYLQIIIETGFVGFILWVFVLLITLWNFFKIRDIKYKKMGQISIVILISLLCNGFFESSLLLPGSPVSIVFWLLILIINRLYYLDNKKFMNIKTNLTF